MIAILAPSKTMDTRSENKSRIFTVPEFLNEADQLATFLKKMPVAELSERMSISPSLARINYDRYQLWKVPFSPLSACHAIMAYRGDVYDGLDADSFTENDFRFAQKQIRILSGLYGILRPLDLVMAYRLEMGARFSPDHSKDLYEFWGHKLSDSLGRELAGHRENTIVNLASAEYFKAVDNPALHFRVITPVFKDFQAGKYRVVALYAKRARGLMASFIVKNRIEEPDEIKAFESEGYYYNDRLSDQYEWVFTRG